MQENETWSKILDKVSINISTAAYEIYFARLKPITIKDGKIILLSPQPSIKNGIEKNFSLYLAQAIREAMCSNVDSYKIITQDELDNYEDSIEELNKEKSESFSPVINQPKFQPEYTFDSFVIGDNSNFAAAAALSVAENPGTAINPLFIYGSAGLGKTHIIQAIGNKLLEDNKNIKVYYTTAENFTNDLIYTIRNSSNPELARQFREKYRNLDVLMIDDVQFLAKKTNSQESLFHVFNDLYMEGKQIILSSDRPISELAYIDERLTSRFASGVVAEITPPSFETRVAILQIKAYQQRFNISQNVLEYIAEIEKKNVRILCGKLNTVGLYALLNHKTAETIEFAKEALNVSLDNTNDSSLSIKKITEIVCNYFNINIDDIRGKKKNKELVEPRQIAMYITHSLIEDIPLVTIGEYFGGRDHTTVIHSRDKIAAALENNNKRIKTYVNDLISMIENK